MRARKYQVVLSLLRKQRDSAKLCEKNNYKQNLLHVLAINRPDNTDVQIKVGVYYVWACRCIWAGVNFSWTLAGPDSDVVVVPIYWLVYRCSRFIL